MQWENLITPEVIVEQPILMQNIEQMAEKLKQRGIAHRPHIKSHKSVELARLQMQCGAIGITCSSIGEALVMASGGINNILVAFPVIGEVNIVRLAQLNNQVDKLYASVNSLPGLENVIKAATLSDKPIGIYLEIDVGVHRGEFNDPQSVIEAARIIEDSPHVYMQALQSYAGLGYGLPDDEARAKMCRDCAKVLIDYQKALKNAGIKVSLLSAGSTLESFYLDELTGIGELRSGNYIFGDMNTRALGLIEDENCALRIVSRVIACQASGQAIIDAGSKTLSSDRSRYSPGFGKVLGRPDIEIYQLNEEHGFIRFDAAQPLNIGDILVIIPNHCCVVPNLKDRIKLHSQQTLTDIQIDARGIVG